jgi:hypothetical protein
MSVAPARTPRSREYVAALATAALLAQLFLSQLTLVIAIVLAVAGRLGRWRPWWLAAPGGAGLVWALAAPRHAASGYLAAPRRLAGYLTAPAGHPGLAGLIGGLAHDLPGQLPLALAGGAAEAAALMWLIRAAGDGRAHWRPGLVAAVRRAGAVRALSAGRTVTTAGCAVGVAGSTGRRAELTWAEAERGVLVCGPDAAALTEICLAAVCAALRRRKAVVVAFPASEPGPARSVATMARSLGIEIADLTDQRSGEDPIGLRAALGQLVRRREVALTPPADATAAGLAGALAALRGHGLRADALAWLHCCEDADASSLRELIAVGRDTGTSVLLSTVSRPAAAAVAKAVGVVIAAGPVGPDAALELAGPVGGTGRTPAADAIEGQPAGTFAIVTPRLLTRCLAVPVLLAEPGGQAGWQGTTDPAGLAVPARFAGPAGRFGPAGRA